MVPETHFTHDPTLRIKDFLAPCAQKKLLNLPCVVRHLKKKKQVITFKHGISEFKLAFEMSIFFVVVDKSHQNARLIVFKSIFIKIKTKL